MKKLLQLAGGLLIITGLLALSTGSAFADIVIKNGSTMKVSSGTSLVVNSDVTVESGGTVSNGGSVTLKGDFTNNGTADLGIGEVIFNGTASQSILGTTASVFGDITINNTTGVGLGVSATVDGTMTLTDGVFDIGSNNLTFGTSSSAVAGTLSSTAMILAEGTGQVRKAFADGTSDPGAFLFPVGTSGEYSPIQIDFNNSTFSAAYTGVNVTANKEPNNSSLNNYLERYWTIVNSGISSYTYDFTATYVDADITGTEADISGGLYHGTGWYVLDPVTAGSNTFTGSAVDDDGNVTGVEFRILSDMKIICEGAYQVASDEMTTALNSNIPLSAAVAYAHIGYTGTESVGAIPSPDIVDWILVEVRDAATAAGATTPGDTVAGFLMKDGSIVSTDGLSPLKFNTLISNNAYFVMIHRNHLAVMTASTPSESFGNYAYDFTDASNKAYGTDALIQVDSSPVTYAMYAGETNLSGIISHADKQAIDDTIDSIGYQLADTNFSAIVTHADKQYIDDNINEVGQVPQ